MNIKTRRGEPERLWYRNHRCFLVDGKWFFATREGENIGPFNTRTAADNAVDLYLRFTLTAKVSGIYAAKLAKNGLWASTLYR